MKSVVLCLVSILIIFVTIGAVYGEEQKGFRLSDNSRLDVYLSLAPEYMSNVARSSDRTYFLSETDGSGIKQKSVSDIIFHISPGLKFLMDDRDKALGISVMMDYNLYTGLEEKDTTENLSTLHINSKVDGLFNKESFFRFKFSNRFTRNSSPESQNITGLTANLMETFELSGFMVTPAETLLLKLSAGVSLNYYEQDIYGDQNYLSYRGNLYAKWKFFPKTALFLNTSVVFQDYYNSGDERDRQNSLPLNIFGGIIGQITPKFSLKLSTGYVNTFSFTEKQDVTAGAEVVYKHSEMLIAKLGYLRNYTPSSDYQYYRQDKIYAGVWYKLLGKKLLLSLKGNVRFLAFGENVTDEQSGKTRDDILYKVSPNIAYNITNWLGLALNYSFEMRDTDHSTVLLDGDQQKIGEVFYDYTTHSSMLSIVVDY